MKQGKKNHFQNENTWSPPFPNAYRVLLKAEVVQHGGKHAPDSIFQKLAAGIKF